MAKWYSGTFGGLKLPDICLTGEEKPRKNLTQETCPDRGSNLGPLRDRCACYRPAYSGGQKGKVNSKVYESILDDQVHSMAQALFPAGNVISTLIPLEFSNKIAQFSLAYIIIWFQYFRVHCGLYWIPECGSSTSSSESQGIETVSLRIFFLALRCSFITSCKNRAHSGRHVPFISMSIVIQR